MKLLISLILLQMSCGIHERELNVRGHLPQKNSSDGVIGAGPNKDNTGDLGKCSQFKAKGHGGGNRPWPEQGRAYAKKGLRGRNDGEYVKKHRTVQLFPK